MDNINIWEPCSRREMKARHLAIFPPAPPPHPGILKPMLGSPLHIEEFSSLKFPIFGSSKIDGIRALIHDHLGPVTRKLNTIPNDHIRELLSSLPPCLDGELVVKNKDQSIGDFSDTQSAVMSKDGAPDFMYLVFDYFADTDLPYITRYKQLKALNNLPSFVKIIPHTLLTDIDSAIQYSADCIAAGHEGAMLRAPEGLYKQGRSRVKQGWMLKIKNFQDAEGIIIGFNPSPTNSRKIATIHLRTAWGDINIGSGLTNNLRESMYKNPDHYEGLTVTFKYQPFGTDKLPRFPVFKGFRYD